MKVLSAVTILVWTATACPAGPTERAILAAMKLSEAPNYSWTATVTDDARTYDIDGRTQAGGCTWLRLPMIRAIARRLGREADNEIEAYFKGPDACVIRTEQGWRTLRELPQRRWEWDDDLEAWPMPSSRVGMGPIALAGTDPLSLPPVVVRRPRDDDDDRVYSNAQCALSLPHEELAVIVSSFTALRVEGDVVTGTLSDLGAQLLLVRDGQDKISPLCAAGIFTLQINGDRVVKYLVQLEGILLVNRKKIHVHQVTHTVVRDVGATRVEVPEAARRKLER